MGDGKSLKNLKQGHFPSSGISSMPYSHHAAAFVFSQLPHVCGSRGRWSVLWGQRGGRRVWWGLLILTLTFLFAVPLQGNTGVLMGMFLVSFVVLVALVTVLSGIGVGEHCGVGNGGVYSMISSVLGGQTGGTIGLLYVFGQVSPGCWDRGTILRPPMYMTSLPLPAVCHHCLIHVLSGPGERQLWGNCPHFTDGQTGKLRGTAKPTI